MHLIFQPAETVKRVRIRFENVRYVKGSVIEVQEHIQLQVGTEIAFYENAVIQESL